MANGLLNREQGLPVSLDACLMEIRTAGENGRANTRRLDELRRARVCAFDDTEPDRPNT